MDFELILSDAYKAATRAILVHSLHHKEQEFNCGFAWVTIDGTEPLARHCHKALVAGNKTGWTDRDTKMFYGSKGYPTGWQFWCPGDWPETHRHRQDMDFHRAGAEAFAKSLATYGIRATVGSRLD